MQFYKGEYQYSMDIAMRVIDRVRGDGIALTPEMFELWYVFFAELNPDVTRELKSLMAKPGQVTLEACQNLYARYLSQDRTEIAMKRAGEQIQETIRDVNQAVSDVQGRTEGYNKSLQKTVALVQGTSDPGTIQTAIATLMSDTQTMMASGDKLHEELNKSAKVIQTLQRDLEIVKREAMTDGLTGLSNRKAFDQELKRMITEAREKTAPFVLMMIDIDHFKGFNDNFGHQVGDQVLRLVGRTLIEGIKGRDFAARYGGEEFAIILPESGMTAGMAVGNALRRAIAMKDVINRNTGEKLGRVTMSVGVAEAVAGESPEELIERADGALYTAKHNGRNQVAAAPAATIHRAS